MKSKFIRVITPVFIALLFAACNDDLKDIGETIQPPNDSISVITDTIAVSARTISMKDSVYARTINGVLGKYEDDLFGTIKSDYLAQFYYPTGAKFENNLQSIDSVQFVIDFRTYAGDSLAPMGLSVYEVNKPLVADFYTNADPSQYCDLSKVLANQAFTINGAKKAESGNTRQIIANLGIDFGKKIYNAYSSKIIYNNETFNNFFKGVYVTTTFGSGTLVDILYTKINIYYKYNDINGNYNHQQDTIRTTTFSLAVTNEVIQLNHIKNTNPEELFVEGTGATYMKTPAGVCTEVEFPIKEIRENMKRLNMKSINSAQFLVNGYTQKETSNEFSLAKPSYYLLIDKDSVGSFFSKKNLPNNISSFYTVRNTSYNTYSYSNISTLINHYNEKGVDKVTCLLMPVEIILNSSTALPQNVYNYLKPSTAVLRSDLQNMRLNIIYSKLNNSK